MWRSNLPVLRRAGPIGTLIIVALSVFSSASCQEKSFSIRAAKIGLEFVKDIPLAGSASRLDYQTIDGDSRRLFIAHLGADMVTVVDVDSLAVVKDIRDVPEPHGILAIPELHQVYVSATGNDQIFVIDEHALRVVVKRAAGHYPDGIAYDPTSKRVFVSDEIGKTVAVLDVVAQRLIKKISLGSEVGNTQYDPATGLIYSAAQSVDELVEIDPQKLEVVARYTLTGCKGPHGFYIDTTTHYAFVTGQDNASYVVFDLTEKRIVAGGKVGDDPDVLAFDRSMHRLYVSSESGVVSVFDVQRGAVKKIGETFLAPDAHTVSVDQKTHLVFFPLKNVGGRPVLRVMRPMTAKGAHS